MPEIDPTSRTTATGIWALRAAARHPDGRTMDGFGHYHDTYEKVDGEWRVKETRLDWLRLELKGFEEGG